jgi:hypothetical protein
MENMLGTHRELGEHIGIMMGTHWELKRNIWEHIANQGKMKNSLALYPPKT